MTERFESTTSSERGADAGDGPRSQAVSAPVTDTVRDWIHDSGIRDLMDDGEADLDRVSQHVEEFRRVTDSIPLVGNLLVTYSPSRRRFLILVGITRAPLSPLERVSVRDSDDLKLNRLMSELARLGSAGSVGPIGATLVPVDAIQEFGATQVVARIAPADSILLRELKKPIPVWTPPSLKK